MQYGVLKNCVKKAVKTTESAGATATKTTIQIFKHQIFMFEMLKKIK